MKKSYKRIKHSLKVRVIAIIMALLMVLFTIPTDAVASILEVSEYQEMEEEEEEIIELTDELISEDNDTLEMVDEELSQEYYDEEEAAIDADETLVVEEEAEISDIGISEITTEVSNDEYDILIVEKTEGALNVVYDLLVENKTDEVSDEIIEKIAKKENIPIEDVVTETLNIELKDENLDETQPEGMVTVSLAIPKEMNEEDFALYYIGDGDATPVKVKGVIEDGYFTFDRSHFCQFCLISTGSGVPIGQDIKKLTDGDGETETTYQHANVGWYATNPAATTFYISTGADLRGLAALTKGAVYFKDNTQDDYGDVVESGTANTNNTGTAVNFSGKTIIITNDINMNVDETFPGIGTKTNPFKGTFDGNGHVIRNLALGDVYAKKADGTYLRDSQQNKVWEKKQILTFDDNGTAETSDDVAYLGMFTYVQNATIMNLGLEGAQAVVSVENPYNSSSQDDEAIDYSHYKISAGLLVAKDLGTTTSLINVYIYNSKISTRDTDHRDIVQAGLVAEGGNTAIRNSYVMKLSLTATTSHARFNANLYSLAGLTNYSYLENTYYLGTTYNGDNETGTVTKTPAYNGHGVNVEKKTEADFIASEENSNSVAHLINNNVTNRLECINSDRIFIVKENGTHPVFAGQKDPTTAKITIQTLHNGRISNAAGYFKYKNNFKAAYSNTYNTKTITISKGYATFGSNVNQSGTAGYLALNAIRKDNGYTFDAWYVGHEDKIDGKTVIVLDETPLSTNPEFVLKNDDMVDMTVYANFTGSPYTLSTLVVDSVVPSDLSEDNIQSLRGLTKVRATVSAKEDPYSEWEEYVYEDDGNIKLDSKGNAVKKLVTKGNIKGKNHVTTESGTDSNGKDFFNKEVYDNTPLNDGTESPYIITWDVKKSGEVTLYCTPASTFSFVAWYESTNTEPYITDDDIFLSDSKEDNCKFTISKITKNHVIKCVVTPSVDIYTFFANDGRGDTAYNASLTSESKTINGTSADYYTKSTYGEIKVAEGSPVGKGAGYTLSARATKGHKFVGWFSVPNPTFNFETNDYATDEYGKYTELLSRENDYTLSLPSGAGSAALIYYAVFDNQATIEFEKNNNVITLHDEALTTKKVVYQYSNPIAEGYPGYAVPDWESYAKNGLGLEPDGEGGYITKDNYAANKDAYAWNGSLGYHILTLSSTTNTGIDNAQIAFKFPGHYTFCIYPSDGSVMYTKDVTILESDLTDFKVPTIDKIEGTAKVKVNANNDEEKNIYHVIKNVCYQLTAAYSNTELPSSMPDEYRFKDWYNYAKRGKDSSVAEYNGKDGYISLGANCDGREVALTEIGWYTFYIKYDDGESEIVYISINSDEINGTMRPTPLPDSLEEGNGIITVLVKYSEGDNSTAVIKVVSDSIINGGSYRVRLTADSSQTGYDDIPYVKKDVTATMSGNANNHTYLCRVGGLHPNTKYKIEAINNAGTLLEDGAVYNFTTEEATVDATVVQNGSYRGYDTGYYAKEADSTAFRINNNGTIDVHGSFSTIAGNSPYHALWTTYNNNGWAYQKDNDNIDVIPTARIKQGANGIKKTDYILFTYVLHNNTAGNISNFRIGFSADTMINTNDYAPVSKEDFGFRICNSNNSSDPDAINFVLIANSDCETDGVGKYTDTCTTKWFGSFSARTSNLYNEIPDGATYNGDSGAAFSYQGLNFAPGEVKTISFILGVAPTSALGVTEENHGPTVGKEGNLGRLSANSTEETRNYVNAVYYQYASDAMNVRVPYAYEGFSAESRVDNGKILTQDADVNLNEFKARGITYKPINGLAGMKVLFEEAGSHKYGSGFTEEGIYNDIANKSSSLYESDTEVDGRVIPANNKTTFEEPGWYTFLIDYYQTKIVVNPDDQTEVKTAKRYLKEVDILVTADDLNGVPFINKDGSMVQIYNNHSGLYSVTYQLTSLWTEADATRQECPVLYTDWNTFYHTGQGLTGSEDANHTVTWTSNENTRTFQKVNSANGYKVLAQNLDNDGAQGTRQLVFTTAGWYTFRLNYRTYNGEAQSLIKYVKITPEDIENGGPRLIKNGNTIILHENNSKVTKIVYQLTTSDEKYRNKTGLEDTNDAPDDVIDIIDWDGIKEYRDKVSDEDKEEFIKDYDGITNEEEFLFLYEYGEGFYYKTVMDDLYKRSSSNSDWVVFTRIGQSSLEDFRQGKTTEFMLKANYTTGYRMMKAVGGNATEGYIYDGTSVTVQNPGWYTFLITYGDGVVAPVYVQITEEDIGNAPNANINPDSGLVTIQTDEYNVLGAYISYATDDYLERDAYPSDIAGLSYYLDNANKYSWYNFSKYGETHYPEINGDDGYMTMITKLYTEEAKKDFVEEARYIVNKAGWYNVYISFMVGEEKKVAVRHVKLPADVAGATVTQVTSDKTIIDKMGDQRYDNRMMLRYMDNVSNDDYPIQKYAVGYFAYKEGTYTYSDEADKDIPNSISSWYRMALATTDVRTQTQKMLASGEMAINVKTTSDGKRYFDIPVDREGYYVVMVIDEYYQNRIYIAEVRDVPILDDNVVGAPKLFVSEKTVTGVKNGISGEEVAYLKDVTGFTSESDFNAQMAKKGNVLKGKVAGYRTIRVVDNGGRVYDLQAILQGSDTDDSELISLIKKANKLFTSYKAVTEEVYYDDKIDNNVSGWWVIDTHSAALKTEMDKAIALLSYDLAKDKIDVAKPGYVAPTQQQIEEQRLDLSAKIADFNANSIIIDNDIIKVVDGDNPGEKNIVVTVGDLISKDADGKHHDVEYFLYSAADLYDVSQVAGYRQIKETVWDSWAGISSEQFNKFVNPTENYVLKNVDEGVYTFQIKIDGVVYYYNPVVVKTEGKLKAGVIKDYLGGEDKETDGLIGEAKALLADLNKESEKVADRPYISDALYTLLEAEIAKAEVFYDNAPTTNDAPRKINVGTTLRPHYYILSDENMIQEAADLHNLIRKVKASISIGEHQHRIQINSTDTNFNSGSISISNSLGKVRVTSFENPGFATVSKMYVARGHHTTWGSFASQQYTECKFGEKTSLATHEVRHSDFNVNANGEYTLYVKYNDNVYGFLYFTMSNYSYKFDVAYNEATGMIDITVPAGNKVTELQIANGEYTKYTSRYETIDGEKTQTGTAQYFKDIWYTTKTLSDGSVVRDTFVKADSINSNGYTKETVTISTPRRSLNEHTVYVKVYDEANKKYDEYFIPVAPTTTPLVAVNYKMESGNYLIGADEKRLVESVEAITAIGNVAWVAYAKGDYVNGGSTGWNAMLQAEGGVRYISQNKKVVISGWDSIGDPYTFYFKGANGQKDYIIVVGGSGYTVEDTDTTTETTAGEQPSPEPDYGTITEEAVDDTYKVKDPDAPAEQMLQGFQLEREFSATEGEGEEESGKQAKFYKVVAYTVDNEGNLSPESSTALIPIPEEGDINVTLPQGLTTKNGDTVKYAIVTYTDETATDEVHTIDGEIEVDTDVDVYSVHNVDTDTIDVSRVNFGTSASDDAVFGNDDNIAEYYTIEGSEIPESRSRRSAFLMRNALEIESDYGIMTLSELGEDDTDVPVGEEPEDGFYPIIRNPDGTVNLNIPTPKLDLPNGVSKANYTITLYNKNKDTDPEKIVGTLKGTYPIKVNGEYSIGFERSTTDNNITFKINELIKPLNGGVEADRYKLTYELDGVSVDLKDDIPENKNIVFANDYAVSEVTIQLYDGGYDDEDKVGEPFNMLQLIKPENDSWILSEESEGKGYRLQDTNTTEVDFTLNKKASSKSAERSSRIVFTESPEPPVSFSDAKAFTNISTSRKVNVTSTASTLYAWIYTETGKLIQRIKVDVLERVDEKYRITAANASNFVITRVAAAANKGATASKYDYHIKSSDDSVTYAEGTIEGLDAVQVVGPVYYEDVTEGATLKLYVDLYYTDNNNEESVRSISESFRYYQSDEIEVDLTDSNDLSTASLRKAVSASTNGRKVAYYGLVIVDKNNKVAVSDTLISFSAGTIAGENLPNVTELTAPYTIDIMTYTSQATASKGISIENAEFLVK